jgi:hypothetical protein
MRLSDEFLTKVDAWATLQIDRPGRSEAIRRLVELGLTVKPKARPRAASQRDRARELAGKAIDKMADAGASNDDQAGRKRRLIKGPEEFRQARVDRKTK